MEGTLRSGMLGILMIGTLFLGLAQPTSAGCPSVIECEAEIATEPLTLLVPGVGLSPCANADVEGECQEVRIFLAYTGVDYEGTTWEAYGDKCDDGDGADYGAATLGGANNDLESGISVGNCWVKYYPDTGYGSWWDAWWCSSTCPNFGSNTNDAESAKLY